MKFGRLSEKEWKREREGSGLQVDPSPMGNNLVFSREGALETEGYDPTYRHPCGKSESPSGTSLHGED